MNPERAERIEIPVLPLRDVVVYPHMVIPLFVGREKSIHCLETAMDMDKKVLLVAQKEASTDEPGVNDLFSVGTVASVLQMLKLPGQCAYIRKVTQAIYLYHYGIIYSDYLLHDIMHRYVSSLPVTQVLFRYADYAHNRRVNRVPGA